MKSKEARGKETGNPLHLAAVADLDKLLASEEKIMEDMIKEDLTVEVDNLRLFKVKGVEELVTSVEDLDSTRGRGLVETTWQFSHGTKKREWRRFWCSPAPTCRGKAETGRSCSGS